MSSRGFVDPEIAEPERRSYRGVLRDQEIGTGTFTVVPHPDRYAAPSNRWRSRRTDGA